MTQHLMHDEFDTDFRALPSGTALLNGQYQIDSYLSSGGFGITYLATDSLGRRVVIKECFPEALCHRPNQTVRTKNSRSIREFNALVDMFVREARSLAQLDHPNIVGVHQIFEANDTAYMVLDFIRGHDAMQLLGKGSAPLSPERIVALTKQLLSAVSAVHDADMLHRDISPDNILIDPDGKPCLIDFGAARQEATKKSRAISALMVVKDGYSPQEFYISGGKQGPASDLYSLGATLFHLITGEAPPNSQSRLAALAAKRPDPYPPLASRIMGYDPNFLRAIDMAMNVFPKDRPQTAQDWAAIIAGQTHRETSDDPQVRRVISALVNEVAVSIAQAAEAEAKNAEPPVEAAPVIQKTSPEDDPWWPLTEPIEEKERMNAVHDLLEKDDLPTETGEFEALQPQSVDVLEPDTGHPEPESAVLEDTPPDFVAVITADADTIKKDHELPDSGSLHKSRRAKRRISALVMVAALTIAFHETVPGQLFGATLTSFGSFVGAVMSGDTHI